MEKILTRRTIFKACLFSVLVFCGIVVFCSDIGEFTRAIFRNPTSVGAAFPSSSFLAKKITKNISVKDLPVRVLEVGAGTGSFTEKIVEIIGQEDGNSFVDVIEIDAGLCEILNKKFKDNKNVHIHCASILDWQPDYQYDFIVSGLPFNAFDSIFVGNVLDKYKKIIVNNGIISYFEYALAGKIRKLLLSGTKKADFLNNIWLRRDFIKAYGFDRDFIFLNIPPAYVYHLRIVK